MPDRFFATGEAEIAEVLAVADGLRPVARGRALDFGCGVGRLTRALGMRYRDGGRRRHLGGDGRAGATAQRRVSPVRVPSQRRAPDLERFETDSFDFVYSNIVLQHLPSAAEIERYVDGVPPDRQAGRARRLRDSGARRVPVLTSASPPAVRDAAPARRVGGVDAASNAADADADDGHQRGGCAEAPRRARRRGAAEAESVEDGPVRTVRYYVAPTVR